MSAPENWTRMVERDLADKYPDYPDNEAEEAAYALLERLHTWYVCGWDKHYPECQRLCEAFGFDGWEHWRGTRD